MRRYIMKRQLSLILAMALAGSICACDKEAEDKKDDISDAVNQALVWMLTNGFLTLSIPQYIEVIDT